jgi:hypothetical protein
MSSFWTSTALEPKRQFRFRLTITAVDGQAAIWYAKKVTVPAFSVGEIKHSFVDKTFYYPGRVEWNTIEATLVDPVNPDAVGMTNKMLAKSGYFIPSSPNEEGAWGSISKQEAVQFGIGTVVIEAIDQEGIALEQWDLKNPFIKSVKYGDLSYDSDELREISIEFRYDWAECTILSEDGGPYFAQSPDKNSRYTGGSDNSV